MSYPAIANTNSQINSPQTNATMSEMLAAMRRDRRWIAAGFAVPALIAVSLAFMTKPTYEAASTLLVRLGREYVYNAESPDGGNMQPMKFDRDQMLSSEVEILTSEDVIEKVVAETGVKRIYPSLVASSSGAKGDPVQLAAREVRRHLNADPIQDSNVIRLSFQHPDPVIAAEVDNRIVNAYLEHRRSIFTNSDTPFLSVQIRKVGKQLAQADTNLAHFERDHGIVSFQQQLSLLLEERQALELKFSAATQDGIASRARMKDLVDTLPHIPADLVLYKETSPGGAIDSAREKLLDLRLKERDLSSKFYDDNPLLVDVRKDISNVTRFLNEQQQNSTIRTGRSSVRDAAETDLVRAKSDSGAAEASRDDLRRQLADITGKINALASVRTAEDSLQREQKLATDLYLAYSRRLQDAEASDLAEQKSQSSVSIVQRALPPIDPKNYRGLILGIGFVLSIVTALLVAFAAALIRGTITAPEGLERALGLPVLANIPRVQS